MILVKAWYRLTGLLLKAFYRVIYGRSVTWGRALHFRRGFQITVEAGGRIAIGDDVFFNNGCALHARRLITIGSGTIFGENVHVYDHNHRFADPTRPIKEQGYSEAETTIGAHCWLGSGVTVLKGAHIGDGCVIGAGCVISGEVPDGTVVRLDQRLVLEPVRRPRTEAVAHVAEPPMRVLVLDTVMDRGGAETMTMNYLRHFDRSRVTYDFAVNRDYEAAYEPEIRRLGGRIWRMKPLYPQYFAAYRRQMRELLAAHPEYRIIHSNLEERSYPGLAVAKEMGVPVRIAHAHNRPVGFDVKWPFREYFRLRLPGVVTHRFACGQEAGDWLFGARHRDEVIQQRNAIATADYRYDPAVAAQVREEFGAAPGTFVLGHVGRFFPQKNHLFLIDVFRAVHELKPDSVLWLVGGGELHDELKDRVRARADELGLHDAVRFLGVRDDVPRLLQGMDSFVLPSLYEGLPVTMVEAQAAGLPCTISDRVPAQCDLIGVTRSVPLSAPPEEWARTILAQAASPVLADRREGAGLVADAGFDIVRNAAWLQDFYRTALAEATQGAGASGSGR